MKYFVVKAKNENLFFNADEGMGEYMCETPFILNKEDADSIVKYMSEVYQFDDCEEPTKTFTKEELEVREVKLTLV